MAQETAPETTDASPTRRAKPGRKTSAESLGPQLNDLRLVASGLLRELLKADARRQATERMLEKVAGELDAKLELISHQVSDLGARVQALDAKVDQVAQAAAGQALASDGYSVQAVEVLGRLRREVAEVRAVVAPPDPAMELAVGEMPSAIVLWRPRAAA